MEKCKECSKDINTNAGGIVCSDCNEILCPECVTPNLKCPGCDK